MEKMCLREGLVKNTGVCLQAHENDSFKTKTDIAEEKGKPKEKSPCRGRKVEIQRLRGGAGL